ncbi:MAG TPA: hypothetical protein DCE44_14695 [Verrucomicrobiales bacterium]|nr:hypothetical protein [Verrucomicrobiales bacterium]
MYSPPPERFADPTATGLSISGNWIQIRNRAYPLTDIVGTSLTRQGWGWRPFAAAVLLILAIAAGFARQWLALAVFVGLMLWVARQLWKQPEQFVVSWITRGGREDRQVVQNRDAAQDLLEALRDGGAETRSGNLAAEHRAPGIPSFERGVPEIDSEPSEDSEIVLEPSQPADDCARPA